MSGNYQSGSLQTVVAEAGAAAAGSGGIDRILHAVRTHLGMDVAFVSQFGAHDRVFSHVDAAGRTPIHAGDAASLENGYCQRVVDGRLPELIPNAHALPAAAQLPETAAIPIGSHLSVPIRLSDGRIYGTFCCFSFMPDTSLTERDLHMMRAFADLVAERIDLDMQARSERDSCMQRIAAAIDDDQPAIVYQPIYDVETGRIAGVESLSRFNTTPRRTPDVWFGEAARVGLGTRLEGCAVRKALHGLSLLPDDAYIAINSSPELILSGELGDHFADANLERIVLEVTEHASVANYDELLAELAPLRSRGLRIAIDDTGAGYSSMRHILSIEPDLVKLDMSLTRGIDRDRKRRALASALIAFARETGIDIIAEGVETLAEFHTLRTLGVRKVQGYLLGRPVPPAEVSSKFDLPAGRSLQH